MTAILCGLSTAAVFATATLCSSRSTRMIGPSHVLAWVMIVGSLILAPWAALEGFPEDVDAASAAWLAVAGLGNVAGLLLAYSALRIGKVGVVAPVVSTQGAIAAVIAAIAGEDVAPGVGVTLGVIAVGILLAAAAHDPNPVPAQAPAAVVAAYAVGAALAFGLTLYATARVSVELPIVWALVPARVAGLLVVALPLVLRSRLRLTRRALPLVLASGAAEVVGFSLFAIGARDSIAITAVLASQFAAIAGVAAYLLFRERLAPVQILGVATIVAGVSVLSVLQA
jgi:drug/metabolite transporter (DMT)-like permease